MDADLLDDRWDAARAATLRPEELLLYRSNLLGSDKRITNYGGGNTSSKLMMADPLSGGSVEVLWVKGSGGDVGSMKLDGFATLYMDKLRGLRRVYPGVAGEDGMVALFNHCTFDLNPRAPSIDTPLHAFVPRPHVDHMHPDAIIAIAASADGERITQEVFGHEIGWLPWKRPGFELGVWLQRFCEAHPNAKGVILGAHGLFTWADDQRECYETTVATINKAIAWLATQPIKPAFGGEIVPALEPAARRTVAAALMPRIRGLIGADRAKVGHFDDQPAVLRFVGSARFERLAALGTSCPDHFLRTKIRPLVLAFDPGTDSAETLAARLPDAIAGYRADYAAYYERCKHPDSPAMRDANPVVYLIPGVGMVTFAADKATARVSAEFYVNAINVMRGASTVSEYRGLPEQEAFDIEYWLLEEAKLARLPKPKALAGKVALITGGAGGIGMATARRLMDEGACVVVCDIDRGVLAEAETALRKGYGPDAARGLFVDVTDEAAVEALYADAAVEYGGIDICVSNAGIASAAPFEDTSVALWRRNMDILATGYFLVSRAAFRLLVAQNTGGSIVFVVSKNGMVASPGASAYCVAKASELHLARCIALEGAPHGIRVNCVNPDAVLRGSRIWQGEWGDQRADSNKTTREGLEDVYRQRSMLKRSVYPEDIAEAVAFFASETRSGKSTGNILNVDAGHAPAFTR